MRRLHPEGYDAAGAKHKYSYGATNCITKYAGAFEYNQSDTLKRIALAEGQAVWKNNEIEFNYNVKDHLGNVRMVFDKHGKTLQQSDYYPFGLEIDRNSPVQTPAARNGINRYNFLGREKQIETGYMDLKRRFYDLLTGRFMQVDPVTADQENYSTYQYSWNNPILRSDPNGDYPECCGGLGDFLTGVGQALSEDIAGGTPISASPGYVRAYNSGREVGHYAAMVVGVTEIAAGAIGDVAAAVGEIGSVGLATPVALPVAAVSTAAIVHGSATGARAAENLRNDNGRVNADSHPNSNKTSGNNSAAQNGQQKHKDLSARVKEKATTKPGWESQPPITGKDGKTYKPDVQTPSGNLLEYKPRTPTGISKGKAQAKKYENQTGQKTRVIYYDN